MKVLSSTVYSSGRPRVVNGLKRREELKLLVICSNEVKLIQESMNEYLTRTTFWLIPSIFLSLFLFSIEEERK